MTPKDGPAERVAVVTGASRGLGAIMAEFLAGEDYDLVIDGRHPSPLAKKSGQLRAMGAHVTAIPGDVADPRHRNQLEHAVKRKGRLDLLVHNAALLGQTPLPSLVEYPLRTFRRIIESNIVAPLALTQLLVPYLRSSQGRVVLISSDAAKGGYPGWGAYGSTKAALDLIGATLAAELAESHVAVVMVDPGDMKTVGARPAFPTEEFSVRPLPEATLPFWAWLLGQPGPSVSGLRFQAQSDRWEARPS